MFIYLFLSYLMSEQQKKYNIFLDDVVELHIIFRMFSNFAYL